MNWHNRPGKPGDPLCTVCGARAPYGTCDSVCTRAKRNGLTRGRQIFHDTRRAQRIVIEQTYYDLGLNYNRPYLHPAYAA